MLLSSIPGQQLAPFPFNLLLCFVAAELSYRIVEMPVLAWRRRRDGRTLHLAPSVPPRLPCSEFRCALATMVSLAALAARRLTSWAILASRSRSPSPAPTNLLI